MHTDAVLTLAQWLSPSFPIGSFSYSHGLETVAEQGDVKTAADVQAWLLDILTHGAGRNDAMLISLVMGGSNPAELDALATALAPSRERKAEAVQQGAAFAQAIRDVWGHDVPESVLPVALGTAACAEGLPRDLVVESYLHAFLSALVGAAQRLLPIGQTDGQRILLALKPAIQQIARETETAALSDIGSASFAADIASMRHETQYSRMFRS